MTNEMLPLHLLHLYSPEDPFGKKQISELWLVKRSWSFHVQHTNLAELYNTQERTSSIINRRALQEFCLSSNV